MNFKADIVTFWGSMLKPLSVSKDVQNLLPLETLTLLEEVGLPEDSRLLSGPDFQVCFVDSLEHIVTTTHLGELYIVVGNRMIALPGSSFSRKLGKIAIKSISGEVFFIINNQTLRYVNSTLKQLLIFAKLYIEYMAIVRKIHMELEEKPNPTKEEKEVAYQDSIDALNDLVLRFQEVDPIALTQVENEYYYWTNVIRYRRLIYSDERRNMLRDFFPE